MDRISREQYRASVMSKWTINCCPARQPQRGFLKAWKTQDLAAAETGIEDSPSRAYKTENRSGTLRRIHTTALRVCQNGNQQK